MSPKWESFVDESFKNAYPTEKEAGISRVQMISICLRCG
jgi:hypothetical protein